MNGEGVLEKLNPSWAVPPHEAGKGAFPRCQTVPWRKMTGCGWDLRYSKELWGLTASKLALATALLPVPF